MAIITRKVGEIEERAIRGSGLSDLSMRQMYYLETIQQMERPTATDLAQRLGLSKPSVTVIVRNLVQNGYIRRIPSEEDKRLFHIEPTDKGNEVLQKHDRFHEDLAQYFSQSLTEAEVKKLVALLSKVADSNVGA